MEDTHRQTITTEDAPKAIGPYSVGVRASGFVFLSGNLGMDPATGELVPGGIESQTRQAIRNLGAILEASGSSLKQVVKTTVFMADLGEFPQMNAVYAEFFGDEPPARSTVEVAALPKGAAVEIEAIAVLG